MDPTFTSFEGDAYALDYKKIVKGYGKYVYEGEKIGTISWDEINISDRHISELFPDVERDRLFGIVLYSSMTISAESCYEFSLSSDDGSKLWIDDQIVIDNDEDHEMVQMKKKISLPPGTYKIKLWYHQAYPDRYGFIFDAIAATGPCKEMETKEPMPSKILKLTLSEEISFDKDKHLVKAMAFTKLDSISKLIIKNKPKKVSIVGHTDNTGGEKYNIELSEKRAAAIQNYFLQKIKSPAIFTIKAMGEAFPISSNETEEGRAKNRRVEIILIQ